MKKLLFISKFSRQLTVLLVVLLYLGITVLTPLIVRADVSWDDINAVIKSRAYYRKQCTPGAGAAPVASGPATGNAYVLGDSISYGLQITNIEAKLKEKLGGDAKVNYDGGRSITGPGSQAGVSPHMNALDAADADQEIIKKAGVVIVVLGTNATDDPFDENLKKLMTKLKTYAPNAKFYWVDIGANAESQAQTWSARNKIIYDNAGGQGYSVISRYKALFGPDKDPLNINPSLPFPGGGDQIHGGYQQLVDEIIKSLGGSAPVSYEELNQYQSLSNRAPKKDDGLFASIKNKLVAIAWPTASAQTPPAPTPPAAPETMTLRDKIAQMLVVRVNNKAQADAAAAANVGGIYVRENNETFSGNAIKEVEGKFKTPPIISTDGEGGQVDAIGAGGLGPKLPSAKQMGAMSDEEVTKLATEYSAKMQEHGFTMDFAPILDLDNSNNSIIGGRERAFSADPNVVTAKAKAFASGLQSNNILPVYKHFPGHGNADGDSHQGAVTTPPLDQLKGNDLKPYESIAPSAKAIMLGHLNVPGLGDPNLPASINPDAIKLLRIDYKFNGVIMTDDLTGMKAITDLGLSQEQALEKAILAGQDILLTNQEINLTAALEYLEKQTATNPELAKRIDESSNRVLALKGEAIVPQVVADDCSCGGGQASSAAGEVNLVGSENAEIIFNFFVSKGYAPTVAAGFIGNMTAESGLNPKALEPGTTGDAPIRGRGYGLIQWTFEERQRPLEEQAAAKGKPVHDIGVQLEYVVWELENKYQKVNDRLKKIANETPNPGTTEVDKATEIIEIYYETHAGINPSLPETSPPQALQQKRKDDARAALTKYGSGVLSASAVGTAECAENFAGQLVGGFSLPLDKKWYDQNKNWFTKPHHDYPAADIPVGEGNPVYSMTAGKIIKAPNQGGYGVGVTIDAGEGLTFIYGHGIDGGSIAGAKEGDVVKAGQLIMNSGNTGDSTGPHLHLEIVYEGKRLCPQNLFVAIAEGTPIPNVKELPTSGCTN